jgi:hypothetical protein
MPRFKKKPLMIEAIQFSGNFEEIERFVGGDAEFRNGELLIATLEGPLHASPNDWIIKGVTGEFYPCKPDIFAATYEPAPHLVMVCGADCHPGDSVCNNYCNLAPQKGPMAAAPPHGPDWQSE